MPDKIAKVIGFKALGAGTEVTDEQLAKINKYALVNLAADKVYVRKYLVAHNGIDRDTERFNDELLENFAKTLPGKGFFVDGHPSAWSGKGGPGEGKFFDSYTEEMTPEEFKTLTGEEIKLPEGVENAKLLWGEAYLLKLESNADTLAKIDAGIYSWVSIGFNAKLNDITDDKGDYIHGEYGPKGEAREASIVWLGSQPGAQAKSCDNCPNKKKKEIPEDKNKGGDKGMKDFLQKLAKALGKTFTEENAVDEISAIVETKDAEIERLKPKAADGEAYRKRLVDETMKYGTLIGEVEKGEEKQKAEEAFLGDLQIDRLKMMKDKYEKRAREEFPDEFKFQSRDDADRKKADADAKIKANTTGKKDYTSPENNELFATVGK